MCIVGHARRGGPGETDAGREDGRACGPPTERLATLGLDGAFGGWLVARASWVDGRMRTLACVRWARPETIARLPARTHACIDMPIGLLDRARAGGRPCDMAARRLLGPRSASVFSPPIRPALAGRDFAEALAIQRAGDPYGPGISRQSFNLLPHLRALDAWITPARQDYVREAHPELLFLHLNGGRPLPAKRGGDGRRTRLALLAPYAEAGVIEAALADLPGKFHTDAIDAIACALVAWRLRRGQGLSLGDGGRDGRGLRMEICY